MLACILLNAIPQSKRRMYAARNMGESLELIQQCVKLIPFLLKLEGVRVEFGKMDFLGRFGIKIPTENGAELQ
jgi:hypothetical protein